MKLRDGTYYCGITSRLKERMKEHNRGENKYTWSRLPFQLVYLSEHPSLKIARVKELRVKKQGVRRWYLKDKFKQPTAVRLGQISTAALGSK